MGRFLWSLRCYSSPTEDFRGSSGGYKDPLEVLNDPNEAPGNMSGAQTGYTSISGVLCDQTVSSMFPQEDVRDCPQS